MDVGLIGASVASVLGNPLTEQLLHSWNLLGQASPRNLGGLKTSGQRAGVEALGYGLLLVSNLRGPEVVGHLSLSSAVRGNMSIGPGNGSISVKFSPVAIPLQPGESVLLH